MLPRQGPMPKGKSVRCSRSATSCGRKILRRCKTNEKADNVVLIDLDNDDFNNIIHVDVPEALWKKSRQGTVITIDDDDNVDDENSDDNPPGAGGASVGDHLNNDASTSGRFFPASNHTHNSVDEDGDDCKIIQDNLSPFKFSKCKRTYSKRTSSRNRFGLPPDSDVDLSDDDLPDSVLMEDSCGKVREQWEKANMKRKCDVLNGQSGNCNDATASRLHPTRKKADVEDLTSKHMKDCPSPSSSNARYEAEKASPLEKDADDMFRNCTSEDPFADLHAHSNPLGHQFDSDGIYPDGESSCPAEPCSNIHEGKTHSHKECNNAGFSAEENYKSSGPSLFSSNRRGNQQVNHVKEFCLPKEKNAHAGTFTSDLDPTSVKQTCNSTSLRDEDISSNRSRHHFETDVNHGSEVFQRTSCSYPCTPMESEHAGSSSVEYDVHSEAGAVPVGSQRQGPTANSGIENDKGFRPVPDKTIAKESSFCSGPCNEDNTEMNMGATDLSKEKDDQVHSDDVDDDSTIHLSIINDKEKLKETDEYKRAAEEEWASRQRELQIQAEEAQRLKRLVKRKKAESMRLLDMERRQKQRVEEMREIQKKDVENMNIKEQLRADIQKELYQLENTCKDMATLLRGLGIQVGSGIQPLPHEVRAAYKRALLSFHPDRASGSDIRQLVEAEEKFKLISRMKEKLLVT